MTQQRRSTRQRGPRRLAPAAFAVRLALMTLAGAGLAIGPQLALAQSATVEHRIPAGPLSAALHAYAAKAGITLSFEESLTAGLRTQGLQGSYGVQQGLDRLLEGTGLDALPGNGGGWRLRRLPQPAQGEATLGTVKVTAAAERSGTTEGSGSYTTRVTTTATRLALSPRETPQTLTVVTRQKMDDFGLTSVDSVLESISGVVLSQRGADGNLYYSRSFALQTQYDGMMNPIGIGEGNRNPSPDSAFLDRVEILQGAAGLLSGAGEPGGTVNLIRKRPTESFQAHVEAQLGSWDKKRLVGDVSGALIGSGKIRGRAVVLWDESDSFVNHVYDDKKGFYGVVDADLTPTTTVGASIHWQQNDGNNYLGVPTAPDGSELHLRRSSFFSGADDGIKKEYRIYTLNLEQKLPADWLLRASYSHNQTDVDNASSYLYGNLNVATGNGLNLYQQLVQRDFSSDSYDLYASGPLNLMGRRHELVFGMNGSKMKETSRGYWDQVTPINIYQFDGDVSRPAKSLMGAWGTPSKTDQRGVYGVARLNLADPLKLILGTRVSWYEYKNAGVRMQKEDAVVTPYAGLIYDIDKAHSAYASYADIFKPQSNLTSSGSTVDPVVGKNYELGIKGEYFDKRLHAGAAAFRLEQTNLALRDESIPYDAGNICQGYCYKAAGLVVSQGVDLSLNGEITSGWQVGAGYTYVHSEHAKGANKGDPYANNMPDHLLRLHTTYRIPATGWTIGGNLRTQSRIYQKSGSYRVEQGSHTLVGLMAKYQLSRQAEIGMTVDNLFDRKYYESVGNPWFYTFYGAPRRFAVNLKYGF